MPLRHGSRARRCCQLPCDASLTGGRDLGRWHHARQQQHLIRGKLKARTGTGGRIPLVPVLEERGRQAMGRSWAGSTTEMPVLAEDARRADAVPLTTGRSSMHWRFANCATRRIGPTAVARSRTPGAMAEGPGNRCLLSVSTRRTGHPRLASSGGPTPMFATAARARSRGSASGSRPVATTSTARDAKYPIHWPAAFQPSLELAGECEQALDRARRRRRTFVDTCECAGPE